MIEKIQQKSREKLKIDNKGINKLTGIEYLAAHSIPVPRIFYTWEEAEAFVQSGKTVLGRTYVTDSRDNELIDVFPTYMVTSKGQFEGIKEKARKITLSEDFARYADQYKISRKNIHTNGFLHEMIGTPNVNAISIITMDIGNGNVLVQLRESKGKTTGKFFSAKEIEMIEDEDLFSKIDYGYGQNLDSFYRRAILIHKKSNVLLKSNWGYQYEMAGSFDLKDYQGYLGVVQVKPVARSKNLAFHVESDLETALTNITKGLQNVSKEIKIVSTDFSHIGDNGKDIYRSFGLKEDEPYILQIDRLPTPRGLLKTGYKYGKLVGIVFNNHRSINACLQHDTNKLMKLVWLNEGKIFFVTEPQ